MQVAAILGEREGGIAEVDDPRPREDFALVKIHASAMCTEYKAFVGGNKGHCLGHEAAGEVVEVAQPCRVKVGDRVVVMPQYPCGKCDLCVDGDYIHCQNGYNFAEFTGSQDGRATMAQYLLKPSWLLPAIPDGVSYDHASLACCALGPSHGAYSRMGVGCFDTVLITGLGPVGLGAIVNARFRGARVIGVESNAWRAERAKLLGAECVVDPGAEGCVAKIMELTGGRGADKSLDCSGAPLAHRLCIDATRRRGDVAFVGECSQDTVIRISRDMIRKGLTLHGAWHYNIGLFPSIMKVIQESPVIDDLISHVFPMSNVHEAWETQASGECAKVILHPWG
jgi:L-iditol 2-dehydrogenase